MEMVQNLIRNLSAAEKLQFYSYHTKPVLNFQALFTDGSSNYMNPVEPKTGDEITVRFRTARENAEHVFLCVNGEKKEMQIASKTERFDFYESSFFMGTEIADYYFEIHSGGTCCYFNKKGPARDLEPFFNYKVTPGFSTPDWAKGAIFYQIYVDRFANGDTSNDVLNREYIYINQPSKKIDDWYCYPEEMDVRNFYGGDLQGVLDHLDYLKGLESVAVAFSGGVDSTFLLAAAKEALGDNVIALTAKSCLFPESESGEAQQFCKNIGVKQIVLDLGDTELPSFQHNPPNRCYICKKGLFQKFLEKAKENQMVCVAEGSNMDDLGDYRPGMQAITELGIKSPLRAAELTKAEIRELSKQMNLPTWSKPSFACLASRFVYGETITKEKLAMVERAEDLLREQGFRQFRVRIHGTNARIELLPEDIPRMLD